MTSVEQLAGFAKACGWNSSTMPDRAALVLGFALPTAAGSSRQAKDLFVIVRPRATNAQNMSIIEFLSFWSDADVDEQLINSLGYTFLSRNARTTRVFWSLDENIVQEGNPLMFAVNALLPVSDLTLQSFRRAVQDLLEELSLVAAESMATKDSE